MIRFYISLLLCLASIPLDAQVVTQFSSRWEVGIAQDIQIIHDKDGNFIIAGYHYLPSTGGGGGSTPVINTFIEKYDVNGVSQWIIQSNSATANNSVQFGSMDVDTLGNIYVLGTFVGSTISFGSTSYTGNASGYLDFFVLKITPNGTIDWITGAEAANSFEAPRLGGHISVTASQELIITGAMYREISLGTIVLPGNSNVPFLNNPYPPCGYVASMSTNGAFLWAKQTEHLASGESNAGNGIGKIVTNEWGEHFALASLDSGFVIDGTPIISTDTSGIVDISAILKLDAAGDLEGYKIIKSPYGSAVDIILDNCGAPILLGEFMTSVSIDTLTITTSTSRDAFVTKFDRNLNCEWLKGYGSTEGDLIKGLAINRQNEVFFSFEFWGTLNLSDTYTPGPTTVVDVALVKIDANGDFVWSMHTENGGYGTVGDVSVSQGDVPYLIGNFRHSKTIQGNTITTLNSDHSDVFICKISDTTVAIGSVICEESGLGLNQVKLNHEFSVYPNPTQSHFIIETTQENENNHFQIISATGAIIKSLRMESSSIQVDVSDIGAGIYFVRHAQSGLVKKLVIE